MKVMKAFSVVFLVAFLTSLGVNAKPDQNGLEERALYYITTEVGGKTLAWTHIVPADTPKNLLGTSPSKAKIELTPFKKGDKGQLWVIRPAGVEPKPSYQLVSALAANDKVPNAPAMLVKINGDFSGDGDTAFHDENNRITVGLNQSTTDRVWVVTRLPNKKFTIRNLLGVKGQLREKGDGYGWAEERAVEAYKTADGSVKLRHMELSDAAGQQWTIAQDGYLP